MFRKMTLAMKTGGGFGLLILIALALGLTATWSMFGVKTATVTTMMQVWAVVWALGRENLSLRSTTGITLPRRLTTPST